jgi:hypothetical protein
LPGGAYHGQDFSRLAGCYGHSVHLKGAILLSKQWGQAQMTVGAAKSAWKALLEGKSGAEIFTAACDGARNAGLKTVGKEVGLSPTANKATVSAVDQTCKGNINQEGLANVSRATSAEAATVGLTALCPPAGAAVVATKECYDLTMGPVMKQWNTMMDDPAASEMRKKHYRNVRYEQEEKSKNKGR